MYFSVPQRRLWWKESRQLIPLVVMLPPTVFGIVLLILLPTLLVSPAAQLTDLLSVAVPLLLGIPLLYSVGVGGLLVGMEKENGTLDWLSSLPVPRRQLVWTKLATGLFWLVILWCICLPFGYAISFRIFTFGVSGQREFAGLFGVVPYIIYSVFLTLTGLAIAWRLRKAWLSIVWLIPVAVLVLIVLSLGDGIAQMLQLTGDSGIEWTQSLLLMFLSLLAGWLAVREGYRALEPHPALLAQTAFKSGAATSVHHELASATSSYSRAGYHALTSPMPALIWQFVWQSRGVLMGIVLILAAGAAFIIWMLQQVSLGKVDNMLDQHHMIRSAFTSPLSILVVAAGISWLGVLVFQCDSHLQRIRFLADRGISPRVVWFSRQIIPFALLSLFLFACFLASSLSIGLTFEILFGFGFVFIGLAALAAISYSVAQWLGQVISSSILAAILAPPISILAVVFNFVCVYLLETPIWYLALVNLIPFMVTWQLTRRWMDRRLGWGYGLRHLLGLGSYVLLPILPLGIALLGTPTMPSKIVQEMEATRQAPDQRLVELVLAQDKTDASEVLVEAVSPVGELDGLSGQVAEKDGAVTAENLPRVQRPSLAQHHRAIIASIEEQLQRDSGPIHASSVRASDFLMTHAELTCWWLRTEESSEATEAMDASSRQRDYRQAVAMVAEISKRLRRSWRIMEQDLADYHEIWLLRQLKRDNARQFIGDTLYDDLLRQVGDSSTRRQQRQAAIVSSWSTFRSAHFPTEFGGYSLTGAAIGFRYVGNSWLTQRRMGAAVGDLWLLAGRDPARVDSQLLQRIAKFWGQPVESYGMGVSGPFLRANQLDQFSLTNAESSGYLRSPARQWSAGWEREAEELLRDMN